MNYAGLLTGLRPPLPTANIRVQPLLDTLTELALLRQTPEGTYA